MYIRTYSHWRHMPIVSYSTVNRTARGSHTSATAPLQPYEYEGWPPQSRLSPQPHRWFIWVRSFVRRPLGSAASAIVFWFFFRFFLVSSSSSFHDFFALLQSPMSFVCNNGFNNWITHWNGNRMSNTKSVSLGLVHKVSLIFFELLLKAVAFAFLMPRK